MHDMYVQSSGGRVETFKIGDDEQLIGCKLDQGFSFGSHCFLGVTWIKMKVGF
jgi:hypothetical protein